MSEKDDTIERLNHMRANIGDEYSEELCYHASRIIGKQRDRIAALEAENARLRAINNALKAVDAETNKLKQTWSEVQLQLDAEKRDFDIIAEFNKNPSQVIDNLLEFDKQEQHRLDGLQGQIPENEGLYD